MILLVGGRRLLIESALDPMAHILAFLAYLIWCAA